MSKVTEKAVAAQLMDHLDGNEGLIEEFQSAYKSHHSTETALYLFIIILCENGTLERSKTENTVQKSQLSRSCVDLSILATS